MGETVDGFKFERKLRIGRELFDRDSTFAEGQTAGLIEANCLRIGDFFLLENAMGEGFWGVVVENGASSLKNDGPGVVGGVDEMDGAPADFCAMVKDGLMDALAVKARAAEGGEQRRVNVHHLPPPLLGEMKETKPTGQAHEIGARFIAKLEDTSGEFRRTGEFLSFNDFRAQPRRFGAIDTRDSRFGRNH